MLILYLPHLKVFVSDFVIGQNFPLHSRLVLPAVIFSPQSPADRAGKQNLTFSKSVEPTKTTKEVLWKTKKKKRKSLESVSKVVMVFLYIKTWLKIGVDNLQNEENVL